MQSCNGKSQDLPVCVWKELGGHKKAERQMEYLRSASLDLVIMGLFLNASVNNALSVGVGAKAGGNSSTGIIKGGSPLCESMKKVQLARDACNLPTIVSYLSKMLDMGSSILNLKRLYGLKNA